MDDIRVDALGATQSALLAKYAHLLKSGFRGTYPHSLDSKGRMIVPSAFRPLLGEKFFICLTPDQKGVAIYPIREWELYFCTLMELLEKDMRMERVVERFTRYTYEDCECDAQGRVLLPQKLRQMFLTDARDVEVSGAGKYIRVTRAEDVIAQEERFAQDIPDVLAFEAEIARGQ